MKNIYIVDAVRTGIGSFSGSLANVSAKELGATVTKALLERNKIDADKIDEVIMGSVLQAGLGQNVARQVQILAGIGNDKTALSINMVCGSGLRAVALAAQAIEAGDASCIIAGGTENMSAAPYLLRQARTGYKMGNAEMVDSMIYDGLTDVFNNYHMGITAENVAAKYNVSRADQDALAVASQNKAEAAQKSGRFNDEIIPVTIPQKKGDPIVFATDEFVRQGASLEGLTKLRSAFKADGTVTAGNASGINDGAAALLIADEDTVKKLGLKPLAKIVSYGYHGCAPEIMGVGPVEAVKKALKKAAWKVEDLDLIEANEAFAAQAIAVSRELKFDMTKVNVNGGAIALGHPIGASGARILVSLCHEMKKRGSKKGLATLCIGGGMGIAMCVEAV